jgi:hypothetical protein
LRCGLGPSLGPSLLAALISSSRAKYVLVVICLPFASRIVQRNVSRFSSTRLTVCLSALYLPCVLSCSAPAATDTARHITPQVEPLASESCFAPFIAFSREEAKSLVHLFSETLFASSRRPCSPLLSDLVRLFSENVFASSLKPCSALLSDLVSHCMAALKQGLTPRHRSSPSHRAPAAPSKQARTAVSAASDLCLCRMSRCISKPRQIRSVPTPFCLGWCPRRRAQRQVKMLATEPGGCIISTCPCIHHERK